MPTKPGLSSEEAKLLGRRRGAMALGVAAFLPLLWLGKSHSADVIKAERFVIVDKSGNERGFLGIDNGDVGLQVNTGRYSLQLGALGSGAASIVLSSGDGELLRLAIEEGMAELAIQSHSLEGRQVSADLSVDHDGAGFELDADDGKGKSGTVSTVAGLDGTGLILTQGDSYQASLRAFEGSSDLTLGVLGNDDVSIKAELGQKAAITGVGKDGRAFHIP